MSHKATTWAIQQRGISPAAKLVLWHLADRFHPDNGCFPSQETLAEDCEMSRSGLNNQLDALEAAGMIRREQRRDDTTNRQLPTRYRFAFEADFNAEPCPEFGHGAVSKKKEDPCPKNQGVRVQSVGHAIKAEPVSEPVIEPLRESAREEKAFEEARRAWPSGFADSRGEALEAWLALTSQDRADALASIGQFTSTTKAIGRKHFCTLAAYLRERRWEALPPRPRPAAAEGNMAAPVPPKSAFLRQWEAKHGEVKP
ncbi:MAG: helix-turn-helix domain-containing protein [Rhizobiaceae bacterium]|nr:helix-turn-helix domain-containing protein [Rhizobiaceae bacterium]